MLTSGWIHSVSNANYYINQLPIVFVLFFL